MRGVQVADCCFTLKTLKRNITDTVGTYHAVEQGYEKVQNHDTIGDKSFGES